MKSSKYDTIMSHLLLMKTSGSNQFVWSTADTPDFTVHGPLAVLLETQQFTNIHQSQFFFQFIKYSANNVHWDTYFSLFKKKISVVNWTNVSVFFCYLSFSCNIYWYVI